MEENNKDIIPNHFYESVGRLYIQLSHMDQVASQQNATISSLRSEIERLQGLINSGNFGGMSNDKNDEAKEG